VCEIGEDGDHAIGDFLGGRGEAAVDLDFREVVSETGAAACRGRRTAFPPSPEGRGAVLREDSVVRQQDGIRAERLIRVVEMDAEFRGVERTRNKRAAAT
jgi:hypothetical protein